MKRNNGWTFIETLVVFCIILLLVGLAIPFLRGKPKTETRQRDDYTSVNNVMGYYSLTYKPIVLEGCEYFVVGGAYQQASLCHKGNCTNAIHYKQLPEAK